MIVDCHTHIWESVDQLGRASGMWDARGRGRTASEPKAAASDHYAASGPVDKSIVLGFKSQFLAANVPNEYIAGYVRKYPDRLVGFAGVDPSRPREAIADVRRAAQALGLKGLAVSPAAQDFHPASTGAMQVYAEASRARLPIVFHQGVHASSAAKMEFSRPYLLDEVAREFPDLKIIVSHLGYPWMDETLALLRKHRNVFADLSGILSQPWLAYNALLSAYQTGVMEALLFGSNFPHSSPAACIETLYSTNTFCHGSNLPTIPREQLRQIVERNALDLLGIETSSPAREPDTSVLGAEE